MNVIGKVGCLHFFLGLLASSCLSALCLTLDEAEALALTQNKTLLATEQLVEKAKEGRAESFSKWYPELLAQSQAYALERSQPIIVQHKSAFSSQLSLTQALFSSDLYYGVKLAELYVEKLNLLLEAARNDVLFRLRKAYYQLILDRILIETTQEKVELLTFLALRMEERYKVGTAIAYSVNQSKVLLANATTFYFQAVRQYQVDMDDLMQVLGLDPAGCESIELAEQEIDIEQFPELVGRMARLGDILREGDVNGPIFNPGFPTIEVRRAGKIYSTKDINEWLHLADCFNPQLQVMRNEISIAQKMVSSKIGEYYPTVQGKANYGAVPVLFELFPSGSFTHQYFRWGVGIEVNWKIFDGLGRERRIAQARYQQRSVECETQKVIQETHASILNAIYSLEEAMTELVNAQANVRLAEQTIILAKQQLEVGYITIFDYQISVDTLFEARNIYSRARYNLLTSYFSLRHAAGIDANRGDYNE